MKKVFYLGYYDTPDNKEENRNVCLAATNKMTYIVSAMEEAGYGVELISASKTYNNKKYGAKTVDIGKHSKLVLFKTLPWGTKIQHILSSSYSFFQLAKFMFKHIGKDDTLVVYHSISYANVVCFFKKLKKFRLVLEVEEIYADVSNSSKDRRIEEKMFKYADSYIFPAELLNDKINAENKPNCISYGTYAVEEDRNCKFNDGKIHVVYAGTFDPRKGGAQATLSAVPYLNNNYHVHIIGFGDTADTQSVLDEIGRLSETCESKVTYDGLLSGEDYIRFLQSCDIGMSTQNPEGGFNDTSFPSKILSYLANGLHVVSVKIPVVENSEIGSMMHFYNENDGKQIADAILSVDMNLPYNSRETIRNLNSDFTVKIKNMLEHL